MGWLPKSDWEWLGVVTLSASEQAHFAKIREVLGDGEASCLAVAHERNGTIITARPTGAGPTNRGTWPDPLGGPQHPAGHYTGSVFRWFFNPPDNTKQVN